MTLPEPPSAEVAAVLDRAERPRRSDVAGRAGPFVREATAGVVFRQRAREFQAPGRAVYDA
jgi:hypothetical protein